MTNDELYNELLQQVYRLTDITKEMDAEGILSKYITEQISPGDILKFLKSGRYKYPLEPLAFPSVLNSDTVKQRAIKVLSDMKQSKNWKEFEKLNVDKRDLNDFEKLLKGIVSVPKPTEKDLKKNRKKK